MTKHKRIIQINLAIVVIVALDQLTKLLALNYLKGKFPIIYWGDLFRFQYAENRGAFLSLGAGLSEPVRFWLLSVIVAGFVLFIFIYLMIKKTNLINTLGWTAVVGGGLGNLIDRFARGSVIDFMNMGIGSLRTGIFNVADMVIMIGMFALLLESIWHKWGKRD